jgi:hypothetical protein
MTVSNRQFGIEIEAEFSNRGQIAEKLRRAGVPCYCEEYGHRAMPHWKIVTDGSLRNGYEIVSPVLSGQEGVDQIKTVCRILRANGVRINRQCGLHVHHDVSDFSLLNWKMLFKQYVKHEQIIDTFMPQSRRANANRYCRSLRISDLDTTFSNIDASTNVDSLYRAITQCDRYVKLNMQSFYRQGTVEFRQHSGTIDADKIIAWVVFTQALVEYSKILKYLRTEGADDFNNLMAFRRFFNEEQREATKFLLSYFRKRMLEVQSEG